MDERVTRLLADKNFDTLTDTEKQWVLSAMTETEFRQVYAALQMAPKMDETVAPPPRLRATLMEQFAAPVSLPQKPQPAWYLRGVPVWQAAAVLLLVAGGVMALSRPDVQKPEPVVQTVHTTDTVFVEKIVWKERVVIKSVERKIPVETAAHIPAETPGTKGTSIADQPELLQFFSKAGEK